MAWFAMYKQTSHCTRVGLHDRESSIANATRQLLVLVNPDAVSEAHAGEALRDTIARMGTFEHAAMTLPACHPCAFGWKRSVLMCPNNFIRDGKSHY
jgi:hypothetical protein